jgi:uncharacterized protein (DUF2062 family)
VTTEPHVEPVADRFPPSAGNAPAAKRPFWQSRVRDPLVALLTQGATPEGLSKTLAWCAVCSMFPFLGTTALLNLAVGHALKLNHALMQTVNQLVGTLHILMILLYVRVGETLWGHTGDRFSIIEMIKDFTDLSFGDFMAKFGWAGVHAFTAWAVTAPLLYWLTYYTARPALRRLARLLPARPTPE